MKKNIAVLVAFMFVCAVGYSAIGDRFNAGNSDLVVDSSGNTSIAGTLSVAGTTAMSAANITTGSITTLTHGTRVCTPATQYGITVSSALVVTSAFMVIKTTGSITSTATPFISTTTATAGQIVEILNGDSSLTLTIKDKGTLSNSCLSLGSATRAIGPGDSITLQYYDGAWRERSFADNQAY